MDIGDGPYGGGYQGGGMPRSTSKMSSGHDVSGEAYLISQATSTAVIAARSILMSGGSEETALKTAKAAAQAVLNPKGVSDNDTVTGKSMNFLRRRKAKRQADVVASMALMSATSGVDWEMMSTAGQSHNFHGGPDMFPSNVAFNNHAKIDETSVLSGSQPQRSPKRSFLPPRAPQKSESNNFERRPPRGPPKHDGKSQKHKKQSPTRKHTPPVKDKRTRQIESSMKKNIAESVEDEDPIYASASNEEDQQHAINSIYIPSSSSGDDEETVDTLTTNGDHTSDRHRLAAALQGNDFIKDHLDPVLTSFTNAFNAFTCGPLTSAFEDETAEEKTPKGRNTRNNSKEKVEVRDDVQDQLSAAETEAEDGDEDETKITLESDVREAESKESFDSDALQKNISASRSSSHSEATSVDSARIIQELNMSTSTEGEIQVRSTIRATMERIASKSTHPLGRGEPPVWRSYEAQQEDAEVMTSDDSPKDALTILNQLSKQMPKQETKQSGQSKAPSPENVNPPKSPKKGWLKRKMSRKHKPQAEKIPSGSSF